jgi:hypothetical protein
MTPEEIKTAVALALREGTAFQWWQYVLALALAFSGAYLGSYAKRTAEYRATKSAFDEILNQLRLSTKATETVKAEHSKVFSTTTDLYRLLVRANRSLNGLLRSDENTRAENIKKAAQSINELELFFSENDIFFNDDHVSAVRNLLGEISSTFHIAWGVSDKGVQPEWDRAIDAAIEAVVMKINPLKGEIRALLRERAGLSP